MATFLYNNASQKFATQQYNWPGLTIWGLLVDKSYVPKVGDVHVSDVPAGAIIVRFGPMTSMSAVNGFCTGILPQQNSLINTLPAVGVVLYINTTVDNTSELVYYSSDGVGFPLALQGFNYAVAFDQSKGAWFQV